VAKKSNRHLYREFKNRMGITIHQLKGKKVGLDTAPLIYFMEQNPNFYPLIKPLFEENSRSTFTFVTSYITLLEVLVHPLLQNNQILANQYQTILTQSKDLEIFSIDEAVSLKSAQLRASYKFRTPDAIQLSVAMINGCDYFLTNDDKLKAISEITVLTMSDL
jgi:predicted nucleic acid-binding protein